MAIVPKKIQDRITFWVNHVTPFTTNAAQIGILPADATSLGAKADLAREKYDAKVAADQAARAATNELHVALDDLSRFGSILLKKVKAAAETSGDGVYSLAEIPPPATPGPVGPPGTPQAFKVELNADGTLVLKWKCANPAGAVGTTYQVARRIGAGGAGGAGGAFVAIGGSGIKEFTDATIPAGSSSVTYQITAVRSTAVGAPAQFTVNFGVGGGGEMTASVGPNSSPKLAA